MECEPTTSPISAPVIIPRKQHQISRQAISQGTLDVLYRLKDAGFLAYIAGGGVRDLLVGRNPKDFDVVTDARPEQVKRLFRHCRLIGRRFRLAHVMSGGETIEVSTFRAGIEDKPDSKYLQKSEEGQILRDNVYGTPAQDAWRRDFTVNGLFYNIEDYSLIDYVDGLSDVRKKLIRVIGDPDTRMLEDPVRMIRAVRFACSLGFNYDPETENAIMRHAARISKASPARMFEEVQKLFFSGHSRDVLQHLCRFNLLDQMMPELAEAMKADERSRAWLERVTRQLDTWRMHNVIVTPELLYSLIFGLIHEKEISRLMQEGMPVFHAAEQSVAGHLTSLGSRILIPKVIGRHLAQLMAVQHYFISIKPAKINKFMHRPCFHDAYIYFKMRARFDHAHADQVAFWDEKVRGIKW
ncbi:MAG TPA: polynucleotide adenylyltransferase PcnB [Kiritimatiellia bacterium]|nr:polynucleotide adenylyltransferase PcnB [Kiritimatiellia bacterium]